jgi:hypothetical protein
MTHRDVAAVKALIADVVLEFHSDLDFLSKDRQGLLDYYDKTGYLSDIDGFKREYAPENGAFLILRGADGIQGCGGLRRHGGDQGELVRLWLRKESRGRGWGAWRRFPCSVKTDSPSAPSTRNPGFPERSAPPVKAMRKSSPVFFRPESVGPYAQ